MTDTDLSTDDAVRQKQLETKFRIALALGLGVVGFFVARIILQAIAGLVGMVVLGALGMATIWLAPVFAFKLANWRMQLIVGEASKNPIETMKNLLIERTQDVRAAQQNIVNFEAEIGNFEDQLDDFKRDYPDEAPKFETLDKTMRQYLEAMKERESESEDALKDFQMRIRKAEAIYKMSLAAAKVTSFTKSAEAEVFAKIKEDVAFDSVRTSLNRSIAMLNQAVDKRNEVRSQLPGASTPAALPPGSAAPVVTDARSADPIRSRRTRNE